MTNSFTQYVHSLKAIGVPLMASVTEVLAWQGADQLNTEERKAYAASSFNGLLTATIVLSNRMSELLGLQDTDAHHAPSLDLKSMAAQVVSAYFEATGDIPDEAALIEIMAAHQSLLSVAENMPQIADASTLSDADDVPALVKAMQALTPLMVSLSRFSFGADTRLLGRRLADDLHVRVQNLIDGLMDAEANMSENQAEARQIISYWDVFKTCAPLLVSSLEAEQDAVDPSAAQPELEVVLAGMWKRFDLSMDLLRQVLAFLFDLEAAGTRTGSGSSSRNVKPVSQAKQEKAEAKKNPMSFFAKKPAGGMGGR